MLQLGHGIPLGARSRQCGAAVVPGPAGECRACRHPFPDGGSLGQARQTTAAWPRERARMSILGEFAEALMAGRIEIVDLTAPLSDSTPIIQLPPPFAKTATFQLEEISRYDERGPAWYWNNIRTGEHTGTHFDAPVHWITGRDGEDVAAVPPRTLVGAGRGPRLLRPGRGRPRLPARGRPRAGVGGGARPAAGRRLAALPHRLGRPAGVQEDFLNADETGPHTPGYLADLRPLAGRGGAGPSASAWRRSARTPARRTRSTRRSRATRSCSAPASTG